MNIPILPKRVEKLETDIRKTRTCERCKTQVPLANVKLYPYNENRNLLLCEPCCNILKNKQEDNRSTTKTVIRNAYQPRGILAKNSVANINSPGSFSDRPTNNLSSTITISNTNPILSNKNVIDKVTEPSKILNRPQMFCERCDYQFTIAELRPGSPSRIGCPYCGKSDRLKRVKL